MYLQRPRRQPLRGIDTTTVPWWSFGAVAVVAALLGYMAGKEMPRDLHA